MGVIFNSFWKVFGGATKLGLQGAWAARPLTGATIGAGYGLYSSEGYNNTAKWRDAMEGAAVGAVAGSMLSKTALRGVANIAEVGFRAIPSVGIGLGKLGYKLGETAWNHPYAALGIAGAGYGLTKAYQASRREGDVNVNSNLAVQRGVSSAGFDPGMGTETSQDSRQMFMDSAEGLTFGLHRGRHG